MTEKQIAKIQKDIRQIRNMLAEEKRLMEVIEDPICMRYKVLKECISIGDYKSGLNFLRWFKRNFLDDPGYPVFLFEGIIVLFKTGKLKDAESLALRTFYSNTYLFDQFFTGKAENDMDRMDWNNWESVEVLDDFVYSARDKRLLDFSLWLTALTNRRDFENKMENYLEILQNLMIETDHETFEFLRGLQKKIQVDSRGKIV